MFCSSLAVSLSVDYGGLGLLRESAPGIWDSKAAAWLYHLRAVSALSAARGMRCWGALLSRTRCHGRLI